MTVLCLVEIADGSVRDSSQRALSVATALAGSAGEDVAAAWVGSGEAVSRAELSAAGVGVGYAILLGAGIDYAPLAWARALAGLAGVAGPVSAVVAAATDRGNEVLAHLAAITGQPMAANCVSATRSGPDKIDLVRQRWAGSLLEE